MAIPQPPQSSAYPPAPQRGEQESVFVPKANAFVASLEPRRQDLQNLADYTYARAVDAEGFATAAAQSESNVQGTIDQAVADATAEAEGYAGTAQVKAVVATSEADRATIAADRADQSWMAASNFKGRWSDLTGALAVPSSVAHDGSYWMLLVDVGDVTASEPGPGNTDWQLIAADSVRRALLEEATLYADFANGDYRLYEGIGGGLVRNKAFSDLFTFTRNSTATGWGASALETVTADVARFVYSPEVKKRAGLAIEEQRTNLALWSEAFDNAVWTKARATVNVNVEDAPDGAASADKLVENAENGSHLLFQDVTYTSGNVYTQTVFVKSAERSFASLAFAATEGFDDNSGITVDLSTGEVTLEYGTLLSSDTEVFKNGWVRLSITKASNLTGVGGRSAYIAVVQNGQQTATTQYLGDGTSGIYIWGAQLEEGSFPTSYIKTEGAQVPRAADNASRTLGQEFNTTEGTLYVEADARSGETLLTLGSQSIVADADGLKKYAIAYGTDPAATSLDFGNATFRGAKYIPRALTSAELEALTS